MFATERIAAWDRLVARYPQKRAALLPILHDVQEDLGCLTPAAMEWVGEYLGLAPAEVLGVATFYWMYDLQPRATHRIAVCRNIACDLRGKDRVLHCLEERLGIKPGQKTVDGQFSLREVECMGACTAAPMMDINGVYHENLDPSKVQAVLDRLLAEPETELSRG
jgi:NADH-quinone oxidoreductase subunit E